MLAWLKTAQGMLATFAAALAIMATWSQLGPPRLVFSPEEISDTLPLDLNSNPLGIGRHVSGIADPFNGHIDAFRISHVQRSDGWIETTWTNMTIQATRSLQRQGPRSRMLASRHCSPALVWSSA